MTILVLVLERQNSVGILSLNFCSNVVYSLLDHYTISGIKSTFHFKNAFLPRYVVRYNYVAKSSWILIWGTIKSSFSRMKISLSIVLITSSIISHDAFAKCKKYRGQTVVVVIVKARLLLKQTNVEMEVFHWTSSVRT